MNTTLTIKLPKSVRDKAKKTAAKINIPLTTVIIAFLKQFNRDQEITLSAKKPNAELQESMGELVSGRGKSYAGTTKDFFDSLEK